MLFKECLYLLKKWHISIYKVAHFNFSIIKLKNGSIDIIRGVDNNYYFLEVNPVGQFGMVSNPCNYNIEEKFALKLIELQNEKKI